jgi:phosphoglycolate phosphatase-like HAD superfamily hydrolase
MNRKVVNIQLPPSGQDSAAVDSAGRLAATCGRSGDTEPLGDTEPFRGARDLLEGLSRRGLRVVLASSGPAEHVERYVDLLGARGGRRRVTWTRRSRAPDLMRVAMERVGATRSFVIGDSLWDAVAAGRPGPQRWPAVLSGSSSVEELTAAGGG